MSIKRTIGAAAVLGIIGVAALGGCDIVAGIGTYCVEGKDPGCGTTATGGTGGTGGSGATTSTSTTGGAGGTTSSTGGGGTGGGPECSQGQTDVCYSGPGGTVGVGICQPGTHSCQSDGTWGMCNGEITPAVEDCTVPEDEDCNFGVGCSETAWSHIFGDGSSQTIRAVAYDSQGNLYAVGTFSGTLDFGIEPLISSGNDVFVVKVDAFGNGIWSQRYGDAASQTATAVAVDTGGNVIVTGEFFGKMDVQQDVLTSAGGLDGFVFKLDPSGNKMWARSFGDAGLQQQIRSVAIDPATDEVLIAGNFDGTLDFDGKQITTGGQQDTFLAKLSKDGNGVWAKRFGDGQNQYGSRLAIDPLGNVFIVGQYFGALDFGAGNLFMNGSGDVYLARFDKDGNVSWAKSISSVVSAQPSGLAVDGAGDVVIAIETSGGIDPGGGTILATTSDAILAKFSSGGLFQWQKQIGGTGEEYGPTLAVDLSKRIVLSFYSDGPLDLGGGDLLPGGGFDVVVSALEPSGDLLWAKRYGGVGDQSSPNVTVGPRGEIAIGCNAIGSINFGTGNLMSAGKEDIVLAEIGPN